MRIRAIGRVLSIHKDVGVSLKLLIHKLNKFYASKPKYSRSVRLIRISFDAHCGVLKVSQAARNQSHIPLERVRSYRDRAFDIHVRVVLMKVAEQNACALIP